MFDFRQHCGESTRGAWSEITRCTCHRKNQTGTYLNWPEAGVSILLQDDIPVSILLCGERKAGYVPFYGLLPSGIEFSDERHRVVEKLGEPARKGESKGRPWYAYDFPEYTYHLEFSESGRRIVFATIER